MANERTVSVKLRMVVRDYITGGNQAVAMNRQLQASQADLAAEAGKTSTALDKLGASAEASGRRTGRGSLYMAAGVAALGASGGALKVLPPLLAAAGTGLAALPTIAIGAAAGLGVAYTATRNVGDALKDLDKASKVSPFAKLTPEAKAFVNEYARLKPALTGIQQGLQGRALTGTAAGLNLLVTGTLPQVTDGLNRIADDWADLFAELALATNQPEVIGAFTGSPRPRTGSSTGSRPGSGRRRRRSRRWSTPPTRWRGRSVTSCCRGSTTSTPRSSRLGRTGAWPSSSTPARTPPAS